MGCSSRSRKLPVAAAALLACGFFLGRLWPESAHGAGSTYQQLDRFSRVLGLIETDWFREPDLPSLVDGAITGMVETLDPHSRYLPPGMAGRDEAKVLGDPGVDWVQHAGAFYVRSIVPGSPAEQLQVAAGDRLVSVDDLSPAGWTSSDLNKHLFGVPGSQVRLGLERHGVVRNISAPRDSLEKTPVSYWLDESGRGYLKIKVFSNRASAFVQSALDEMSAHGPLEGLVLDLRGNAGGFIGEGVAVAEMFLAKGVIFSSTGRLEGQRSTRSARDDRLPYESIRLAVLVDPSTASASEIVAAALRDNGRALLFGSKTYGKGSLQNVYGLLGGATLRLTVAHYFTPKGIPVDGQGLEPDVLVHGDDGSGAKIGSDSRLQPGGGMIVDAVERKAFVYIKSSRGGRRGMEP